MAVLALSPLAAWCWGRVRRDGDEVGIIGKQDEVTWHRSKGSEVTTTALGEGAIEGVAADYAVASKFATNFKYSRWGKTKAAWPCDISQMRALG